YFFNQIRFSAHYALSLHDALPISDIGSVREYLTQASRSELKEGLVTVCAWSDHPAFRGRSLTATVRELDGWLRSCGARRTWARLDRKSTRLNSSHVKISYAVFCLK